MANSDKLFEAAKSSVGQGETIEGQIAGKCKAKALIGTGLADCVMLATTRQLVIHFVPFVGKPVTETIPYSNIAGVDVSKNIWGHIIDIRRVVGSFEIQMVKTDPSAFLAAVRNRAGTSPSAAPASDPIEMLEKLVGMHKDGVISDSEFAAQKKRLLGT